MTSSEVRQAITALRQIARTLPQGSRYDAFLEDAVNAVDAERPFAGYSKLANTAWSMVTDAQAPELRAALSSLAYHAYSYCVENSRGRADFTPSRNRAEAMSRALGGIRPSSAALGAIHEYLNPDANTEAPPSSVDGNVGTAEQWDDRPQAAVAGENGHDRTEQSTARVFQEAVSVPVGQRLAERLAQWQRTDGGMARNIQTARFEAALSHLLKLTDQERRFGSFAVLDEDLTGLRQDLERLDVPRRPQDILERAQVCRNLTPVEFRLADPEVYRIARRCWLVSAFWNSALTAVWATNVDQFYFDVLGYLTVIQAEHRYATHAEGVMLLLRVSHLICRIASSDELVPTSFYEKSGRIEGWVRYAVGTVLAISGPGRVAPSRIKNDSRFLDADGEERDRDEFGAILLPMWTSPDQREAACAILLELAGWNLDGAKRLLRTTLRDQRAECEVWARALADVMVRARRVKVLRPNPWESRPSDEPGARKMVTADTHALAVLASDVIHRTFPALESNISLNGTSFRDRRVPTFICSADFGPLGMFKADARERVGREAKNFTRYAQRLHPRYRASRCDESVAAISEPDDRIEFVSGLLTSYVFTEDEAPRSLNSWFQDTSDVARVCRLVEELFQRAVKPWYQHATRGVLDIISEYDLFSEGGLQFLKDEIGKREELKGADMHAVDWLEAIVAWVMGRLSIVDARIQRQAADLQVCDTLRAVTHGDLHMDNVMVLGAAGAEYPCLIDFETTKESHLLRDLGRFVGAVLFRTFEWTPEEVEQLRAAFARGTNRPDSQSRSEDDLASEAVSYSERVKKAVRVINVVWKAFVQYWRADSRPSELELVATLVCSFLPFARYPDTKEVAAGLALTLCGDLVRHIWQPQSTARLARAPSTT